MDLVREVRVWPGAGGLELFRLQLGAILGGRANPGYVTFVVEATGCQGPPPLWLPGLSSYGVASYCAAIGAALASDRTACTAGGGAAPVTWGPSGGGDSGGGGGDDTWIELLCSVADLLEGEGDQDSRGSKGIGPQPLSVNEARGAATAATSAVTVWVTVCAGAEGPIAARGPAAAAAAIGVSKVAASQSLPYDVAPRAPPPPSQPPPPPLAPLSRRTPCHPEMTSWAGCSSKGGPPFGLQPPPLQQQQQSPPPPPQQQQHPLPQRLFVPVPLEVQPLSAMAVADWRLAVGTWQLDGGRAAHQTTRQQLRQHRA